MARDPNGPAAQNKVAAEAVTRLVRSVIVEHRQDFAGLMVVMESVMLGVMLVNIKHFKLAPNVAAGLMDEAVHRATERLTKQMKEEGH